MRGLWRGRPHLSSKGYGVHYYYNMMMMDDAHPPKCHDIGVYIGGGGQEISNQS